ncbi:acyloxyacyl hydrolase [Leptolyngbya sp. 15MV]|nr:acyloxyacyl hydrolase [Leptolyngbya sp. 15MV]
MGGGVAHNFASDNDLNFRVAYSRFIGADPDQPVEFFAELNLWSFLQKGDDALGINPAFGLRWHFFNGPRWSWFADAGIGLLFSTGNVPDDGTSFNFTPRFGLGATWQMSPSAPDRLQIGLRWHHVSNARINGDVRNPARDSLMIYAGVMLPF